MVYDIIVVHKYHVFDYCCNLVVHASLLILLILQYIPKNRRNTTITVLVILYTNERYTFNKYCYLGVYLQNNYHGHLTLTTAYCNIP